MLELLNKREGTRDRENKEFKNPPEESNSKDSYIPFWEVFKKLSKLSLPMAASFTFSFQVFFIVFLLQQYSESDEENAAATLVSTVMNTIGMLSMCPLMSVTYYLSAELGKLKKLESDLKIPYPEDLFEEAERMEDDEETKKEIQEKKEFIASANPNSLLIAAFISVPASIILYYSRNILVQAFGQEDKVAAHAEKFLQVYAFAMPGLMARMSFQQVLFSFCKMKEVMGIGLVNLVIGGSLSISLMPKYRAAGAAWGFVAETYLTAFSSGFLAYFDKECREFEFFKNLARNVKKEQIKDILKIGGSIWFGFFIELALAQAVAFLSGILGEKEQSAMAYDLQVMYFVFIVLAAFSYATPQQISSELGVGRVKAANSIARHGLLSALIYVMPLPLIFAIFPKLLETMGGGASEDVSKMLKTMVPIMSLGTFVDSIRYYLLQQLRPLGDLVAPNVIATVGMATGISSAAVLGFKTPLGLDGIATGFLLGNTVAATALILRSRKLWKEKMEAARQAEEAERNGHPSSKLVPVGTNRYSSFSKPKRNRPDWRIVKIGGSDGFNLFVTRPIKLEPQVLVNMYGWNMLVPESEADQYTRIGPNGEQIPPKPPELPPEPSKSMLPCLCPTV